MIFEGFVNVAGGRIFCKLDGDESSTEPVIVVFPGGPGFGHEIYQGHSGDLAEHARLLFFDPLGTGQSSSLENILDYTLDNYIVTAKALIDHFNFEQVIILGTSYGSMAALNFAIKYPEITQKIILVGGAPSHHFLEEAKRELNRRGTQEQINICEQKLFPGEFKSQQEIGYFLHVMTPLYSYRAAQAAKTTQTDSSAPSAYRAACAIDPLNSAFASRFDSFDYRNSLPDLTMPALLLVGEHDWINPVSQVQLIADGLPNAKLFIVKNSGHSVAVDRPDIYKREIVEFINQPVHTASHHFSPK